MKRKMITMASWVLFLAACSSDGKVKSPGDTSATDSAKKPEVHIPKADSTAIDLKKSSFNCSRAKTVKDFEKVVNIFGGKMNVKLDNASFTANTAIRISSGNWYTLDGKFNRGRLVLDMAGVSAVKVGADQQLEMGNPDYLQTKKYPYAYLDILSIQPNPDSAGAAKSPFVIAAKLTLKDSVADIEPKHVKCENIDAGSGIPQKISFDFTINGIKWGLNKKDVKVTKDELTFHVVVGRKE